MGRILAIDLGKKRTGLAVTDPLQMIANPLDYVATSELFPYLKAYTMREPVEIFVVGIPVDLNSQHNEMTEPAKSLAEKLKSMFPSSKIITHDERFTSKMALQSMITGGTRKSQRREKGNIDKISATIILQSYLESVNKA